MNAPTTSERPSVSRSGFSGPSQPTGACPIAAFLTDVRERLKHAIERPAAFIKEFRPSGTYRGARVDSPRGCAGVALGEFALTAGLLVAASGTCAVDWRGRGGRVTIPSVYHVQRTCFDVHRVLFRGNRARVAIRGATFLFYSRQWCRQCLQFAPANSLGLDKILEVARA